MNRHAITTVVLPALATASGATIRAATGAEPFPAMVTVPGTAPAFGAA